MLLPENPLAILTFISAPAVLTNASCVLLFGTGNRYGRAVDRVHSLADTVQRRQGIAEDELHLRIRQLEAGESRTLLIVRALTCFYTAVAGFVASTLLSLMGALLASSQNALTALCFVLGFLAGSFGVTGIIVGALLLARETTFSFRILREEKKFFADRVRERLSAFTAPSKAI